MGALLVVLGGAVLVFHRKVAVAGASWWRAWGRLVPGYEPPAEPTAFDQLWLGMAIVMGLLLIVAGAMFVRSA